MSSIREQILRTQALELARKLELKSKQIQVEIGKADPYKEKVPFMEVKVGLKLANDALEDMALVVGRWEGMAEEVRWRKDEKD
ncbi:hypothetical protein [Aureibacillus halotolerans]|uniref:Uncharacterized protein n=1 Tax=Aureibacillus halotolerans TaxID=1508390 RepID=A0A4R6TTH2_9BACI|nr:hypothetical protein [Aureibacillus halotolerans]TDQ35253.1 hypothetical protein EV213_12240 [Aureibacillus halotolerans]